MPPQAAFANTSYPRAACGSAIIVGVLVSITAPQANDRGPQYMEKVFSSILDSIDPHDQLQLAYGTQADAVGIFCRFDDHLEEQVSHR